MVIHFLETIDEAENFKLSINIVDFSEIIVITFPEKINVKHILY